MRRRTTRKDSDISGVMDLRYTGGVKMLLILDLAPPASWGFKKARLRVPVVVSDLDVEGEVWIKARYAPMPPWVGQISLGFVGPPTIRVQLSPYNRIPLMRIPIIQNVSRELLTVQIPSLMVRG